MSEKLQERLKAFTYHKPSEQCQGVMSRMRGDFQDMCEMLDATLTESREKSLAFTALEECGMWAMKALSHHDPDGQQISP